MKNQNNRAIIVNTRVPPEIKEIFENHAKKKQTTTTEILRNLLIDYLISENEIPSDYKNPIKYGGDRWSDIVRNASPAELAEILAGNRGKVAQHIAARFLADANASKNFIQSPVIVGNVSNSTISVSKNRSQKRH